MFKRRRPINEEAVIGVLNNVYGQVSRIADEMSQHKDFEVRSWASMLRGPTALIHGFLGDDITDSNKKHWNRLGL